jgi:predicted O-methyltransferase YrrM
MLEETQQSQDAVEIVMPINIRELMADIEAIVPEGGDWCSVDKALALTTLIVGLRPKIVVELGVWRGGSAIPMAIALHRLGAGRLIAIDSWSAESSIAGQEVAHAQWWGEKMGDAGHELALETFMGRLAKHKIGQEICWVVRQRTDEAIVPESIDLLHHDANHGPQVVLDIQRWVPAIRVGGVLVIDDLNWPGGHVVRARDLALEIGFTELYAIGTGCVMQRVR